MRLSVESFGESLLIVPRSGKVRSLNTSVVWEGCGKLVENRMAVGGEKPKKMKWLYEAKK